MLMYSLCLFEFLATQDFSSVAERTETYTAFDYADINDHLLQRWNIANLTVGLLLSVVCLSVVCQMIRVRTACTSTPLVLIAKCHCACAVTHTHPGILSILYILFAQGLSGEAAEAQEYLVKLPNRIRKLAERAYGEFCVSFVSCVCVFVFVQMWRVVHALPNRIRKLAERAYGELCVSCLCKCVCVFCFMFVRMCVCVLCHVCVHVRACVHVSE